MLTFLDDQLEAYFNVKYTQRMKFVSSSCTREF